MDALVYLLLFTALAIGFFLGRWPLFTKSWRKSSRSTFNSAKEQRYIAGLNQLLNEQPDAAIDTFISALDVSQNTLETHFALGALWRRRGEVERAIRIHQNLMARSSLEPEQLEQAQCELGLDYLRSGLLDRAESLFRQLSTSNFPAIKTAALQQLVHIYEQEQEWHRAIDAADALCHKKMKTDVPHWRYMQAHYCCEMAEPSLAPSSEARAREWLNLAQAYRREHPRARIMTAKLDLTTGDAARALRSLRQLDGKEEYLIEVVPLALECYSQLDDQSAAYEYLAQLYQNTRLAGLLPYMAERICDTQGNNEAVQFLLQELPSQPQHTTVAQLLQAVGPNNIEFANIQPVINERLNFTFHCRNCGFDGTHLYWTCPSCKAWI